MCCISKGRCFSIVYTFVSVSFDSLYLFFLFSLRLSGGRVFKSLYFQFSNFRSFLFYIVFVWGSSVCVCVCVGYFSVVYAFSSLSSDPFYCRLFVLLLFWIAVWERFSI